MSFQDVMLLVSTLATASASIISALAIYKTIKLNESNKDFTKQLHDTQIKLAQRQILIPIWESVMKLQKPIEAGKKAPWNDVIALSNRLELIALCWEGDVIDEAIIKGSLRKSFEELWEDILNYEDIIEQKDKEGNIINRITVKGKDLVEYNKAAHRRYETLRTERINSDKVTKLT